MTIISSQSAGTMLRDQSPSIAIRSRSLSKICELIGRQYQYADCVLIVFLFVLKHIGTFFFFQGAENISRWAYKNISFLNSMFHVSKRWRDT